MFKKELLRAKEILEEKGWAQGSAVDLFEGGSPICLGIAIDDAFHEFDIRPDVKLDFLDDIEKNVLRERVVNWNDLPTTKYEDVVEVIDRIIAL